MNVRQKKYGGNKVRDAREHIEHQAREALEQVRHEARDHVGYVI